MRKLLYLHGFNSSPQSHKAQLLHGFMQQRGCGDRLIMPQIPEVPGEAVIFLGNLAEQIRQDSELSIAGSSLGGYYATWLAEKYNCPAVLINPSVKPFKTLEACLGENKFYYSNKTWVFDTTHISQLRDIYIPQLSHPENFLVLLQTGDETLDYREAEEKYHDSRLIIEEGGDHAFNGFENHLGHLLNFCLIECMSVNKVE